jgi:CCR4-NOT transcription complex subunit 1
MSRPSSTVSYTRNEHMNPALYAASPAPEPALAAVLSHQEAVDRFTVSILLCFICGQADHSAQVISRDLEGLIVQLPIQSLAALPPNHDLRHLVRQILFVAANSVDRHRTPLHMSQKIVQLLYKTSSQLGREIYVALLDQLCHSFEDVAKEAITWLLYAEDEVSHV